MESEKPETLESRSSGDSQLASEPTLIPETAERKSDKRFPRISTPVWVAIITGIFLLLAAIINGIFGLTGAYFKVLPNGTGPDKTIRYTGKVIDAETELPLPEAKVIVETQGAPQDHYTDSKGIFSLDFPASTTAARLRIEEADHEKFNQNVTPSRTGIEIIPLPPLIKYSCKVADEKGPIKAVSVSVKIKGVEQPFTTDSDGIFHLKLPRSIDEVQIQIKATGHEDFDQTVRLSRAGTTDVRIKLLPPPEPKRLGGPSRPIDWEQEFKKAVKP
jgi:hypothetical protein